MAPQIHSVHHLIILSLTVSLCGAAAFGIIVGIRNRSPSWSPGKRIQFTIGCSLILLAYLSSVMMWLIAPSSSTNQLSRISGSLFSVLGATACLLLIRSGLAQRDTAEDHTRTGRSITVIATLVVAGVLIPTMVLLYFAPADDAEPRVQAGTALAVDPAEETFTFKADSDGREHTYSLRPPIWFDQRGANHRQGVPECLAGDGRIDRPVEIAVVDVIGGTEVGFAGERMLVSVRCR